ncbi:MAG: LptF/LptG family permease, partial [Treponema sp.]|nr:LptF/LptG family permease [Treponema sp.]
MTMFKYLFRKFLPLFIGAVFFFSFALVMVDLLMNLWNFISNEVAAGDILYLMWLYIPKTLWYATPMGILFAVSYTLSDLYARNELVAIFASGISLLRFSFP